MLKLSRWFAPPRIARLVDAGRVFCPVQVRDVDVERCAACPFLGGAVRDDDALSEIVCQPTLQALTPLDAG